MLFYLITTKNTLTNGIKFKIMKKPKKLDYQVYERVDADPEYKIHRGIVYNSYMYKEAIGKFNNLNI